MTYTRSPTVWVMVGGMAFLECLLLSKANREDGTSHAANRSDRRAGNMYAFTMPIERDALAYEQSKEWTTAGAPALGSKRHFET